MPPHILRKSLNWTWCVHHYVLSYLLTSHARVYRFRPIYPRPAIKNPRFVVHHLARLAPRCLLMLILRHLSAQSSVVPSASPSSPAPVSPACGAPPSGKVMSM